MTNETTLTVPEAQRLLSQFNTDSQISNSALSRDLLRQAILLLTHFSDYQILGICADTAAQGYRALQTYAAVLGYETTLSPVAVDGPVYIKFNPHTGYYLDSRLSKYRGVLVSYQSSDAGGINATYGHFPLDLFASGTETISISQ